MITQEKSVFHRTALARLSGVLVFSLVISLSTAIPTHSQTGEKISVGILPFDDASGAGIPDANLAVLSRQFRAQLIRSGRLTPRMLALAPGTALPLEPEQAAELGRAARADLVAAPTVVKAESKPFQKGATSGRSVYGIQLGGVRAAGVTAEVKLQVDLIRTSDGQSIDSFAVESKKTSTSVSTDVGGVSSNLGTADFAAPNFQSSPLGQALNEALTKLSNELVSRSAKVVPRPASGSAPGQSGTAFGAQPSSVAPQPASASTDSQEAGSATAAPQTYSITEINSMWVAGMTISIYRDGSKVLMERSYAPRAENPKGYRSRTLYDLQAHKDWTWDLIDASVPCGAGTFSGDWGDPFAFSASVTADLPKQHPREVGLETVNGIATKVFEAPDPQGGEGKLWLDTKYGLIIKLEGIGEKGQHQTMLEVKEFSLAKPPASVLVLPPACASAPTTSHSESTLGPGGKVTSHAEADIGPPGTSVSQKGAPQTGSGPDIYVLNFMGDKVVVFSANSNGNAPPARTIEGNDTGIDGPSSIAFDQQGRIYVLNSRDGDGGSVTVYAPGASGDARPIWTIAGDNIGLRIGAAGLTVDGGGNIYVSQSYDTESADGRTTHVSRIKVFAAGANGNVKPIRTIEGSATRLDNAKGLAVDKAANLYVANSGTQGGGKNQSMRVTVYAPGANGNVAPIRAIEGPDTGLDTSMFLGIDATDNLYVANLGQSTGVTTVTVYPPGANGNARPLRTLMGPNMKGSGNIGNALAVDAAGNVYMTDFNGSGISIYGAGATGNRPALRTILGSSTQLDNPKFIAVWPMGL